MTKVFIAAGSNLDPKRNLKLALAELEQRFGPLRVSRAYRNRAIGFTGPDFINLAVGLETDRDLRHLVAQLHAIEALCGRPRHAPKWASRAMDLDVLLFGDITHEADDLKLPRPGMLNHAYMLGPLAEIAPGLRHPLVGKTFAELWCAFDRDAHPLTPVELLD